MKLMRIVLSVLVLFLVGVATTAKTGTLFITVPNTQTSLAGNEIGDVSGPGNQGIHLQELYGSGQFFSVGSPLLIDQMAFRAAPGTGAFSASASLNLFFSTSSRFPNTGGGPTSLMSNTFADNIGPDNTLVYSGPMLFSSGGCAAGTTPCAWDMVINLTTPFLYNPVTGRLLADMQFTGFTGSGAFDIQSYSPSYGTVAMIQGAPGDAVGGGVGKLGLVTRFGYTAVPEPSCWSMLLLGGAAFGLLRHRRS